MAAYLIPNTYYLHRQWIHWLFPVFSHVHDALPDLAFHPLEADSPYMTHHPNDNTDVLNCVYTLPPTITNVCRDPTYRTRTAFFAVLGQIAPDGLVFDHSPAPRLTHPDHMVTSLAFWVEARPDPVSEREWQLTLNALNSLVDLVDRPVDTSRLFEVGAGGRVRIRVHGANWRTATYVSASTAILCSILN